MRPAEEAEVGTSVDAFSMPSSLTVRRQAALELPNFELPPLNNLQFTPIVAQEYSPLSQSHHPNTTAVSVGNLLAPPSNVASATSATSASALSHSTSNHDASGPVLPYIPTFFNTVSKPGLHTGFTPQPWEFPPRSTFSSESGPLMRNSTDSVNIISALLPFPASYEDVPPSLVVESVSKPFFIRPPYPSYALPPMPGPVDIYAPMPAVGNTGGLPITTSTSQSAQQPAQNDRPFRCDSCPQSFNRNHDLKRHKRIHLAVKPFPCNHCGKSFSRRDALEVSPNMTQQISII